MRLCHQTKRNNVIDLDILFVLMTSQLHGGNFVLFLVFVAHSSLPLGFDFCYFRTLSVAWCISLFY